MMAVFAPFFALALSVPAPKVKAERFLACIEAVEGRVVPPHRAFFGLTLTVWRQHTHLPWAHAFVKYHALYVAEKHLRWLESSIMELGYEPTPYRLAVCWRHGLEGGKRLWDDPTPGYGWRVQSLYDSPQTLHL